MARGQEAQAYLDRVGAALADLPDEDRADLVDELGGHLDELAAEGTTAFDARLGSPEDYAAELRSTAGLPPAGARGRAGARLLDRLRALLGRSEARAAADFLVALRPVWWVLRAWVLVALLTLFPGQATPPWSDVLPFVPRLASGLEVGLVALLAAVVLSVEVGRRQAAGSGAARRGRQVVVVLNVLAAVAAIPMLTSAASDRGAEYVYVEQAPEVVAPPDGVYAGGQQVWNIYAYDAAGTMLHDVRLYDQAGKPLSLGLAFDPTRQQTLDAAGAKVDNAYPYRYLDPTSGRVTDPEAAPSISAPPLLGVATAPTVPTPAPSTSPTAGKG